MSDIAFKFDPFVLALIGLYIAAPGFVLGAIIGAIAWRAHRIWGAILGLLIGGPLWFAGWLTWRQVDWFPL